MHATNKEAQIQRKGLSNLERKSSRYALHALELATNFGPEESQHKTSKLAMADFAAMVGSTTNIKQKQKHATQTLTNKQIKKRKMMLRLFKRG